MRVLAADGVALCVLVVDAAWLCVLVVSGDWPRLLVVDALTGESLVVPVCVGLGFGPARFDAAVPSAARCSPVLMAMGAVRLCLLVVDAVWLCLLVVGGVALCVLVVSGDWLRLLVVDGVARVGSLVLGAGRVRCGAGSSYLRSSCRCLRRRVVRTYMVGNARIFRA